MFQLVSASKRQRITQQVLNDPLHVWKGTGAGIRFEIRLLPGGEGAERIAYRTRRFKGTALTVWDALETIASHIVAMRSSS